MYWICSCYLIWLDGTTPSGKKITRILSVSAWPSSVVIRPVLKLSFKPPSTHSTLPREGWMLAIQPLQKSGDRLEDSDPTSLYIFPSTNSGPEIPQNRYAFGRLDPLWCGRPNHRLIDDPSNQPWLVVTIKIPKTKYTQYLLGWLHLYLL